MRILVVEDHAALARFIAATLEGAGWEVVGPLADSEPAIDAIRTLALDLVLMDRSLHGDDALTIADVAGERGIPCILVSGYPPSSLPERFRSHPFLEKPFTMEALIGAVRAVLDRPR
jgi:DNA-binding response OmpR family regulator